MNGGHRLAYDFILGAVKGDERVLDLGAGASKLASWLAAKGCKVIAADWDTQKILGVWDQTYNVAVGNITEPSFWQQQFSAGQFDLVIAKYSVQHMLGSQCFVWSQVARALKSGGRFIHVGRYRTDAPVYERDREDPLLANNVATIQTLAENSGLNVAENHLFRYEGESFCASDPQTANAIISVMVKP